MISVFYILLALTVLAMIIAIAWRFASRRYMIPCPVWMSGLLDTPHATGMSARTQQTIQHLDLRAGMNVLDAGCGPGRLTIPVAHIVGPSGEVTAMDLQEGMLREAKERAHAANLTNIRFLLSGIGEIPERDAALREIFVALKLGGILLVEETIRDPHFQTRSTVVQLACAAGFIEKEFSGNFFSYTLTLEKPSDAL
jgi:ubiquinone/menaquinone biosynthesis C-methylase UbiE